MTTKNKRGAKDAVAAAVALLEAPTRGLEVTLVPLREIVIGKEGNRPVRDPEGMAASIRALRNANHPTGLLNPIVLRALEGGGAKMVAGRRRLAGWRLVYGDAEIPAFVVDSDEALHQLMTLAENKDREQLTPGELLAQYRAVVAAKDMPETEMAAALGVDMPTFRALGKLGDLAPCWVKAIEGDSDHSAPRTVFQAAYIATLPVNVQEFLFKGDDLRFRDNNLTPVTLPNLQAQISKLTVASLEAAPWDLMDAKLFPAAGACSTCPKREGKAELWGSSQTTCLDRKCFLTKQTLHLAIRHKQETGSAPAVYIKPQGYRDDSAKVLAIHARKTGAAVQLGEYYNDAPAGSDKPVPGSKPVLVVAGGQAKIIHVGGKQPGKKKSASAAAEAAPKKTLAEKREALRGLRLNQVAIQILAVLEKERKATAEIWHHKTGNPPSDSYLLALAAYLVVDADPEFDEEEPQNRALQLDDLLNGKPLDVEAHWSGDKDEPKKATARELIIRRIINNLDSAVTYGRNGSDAGISREFEMRLLSKLLKLDWDAMWQKACLEKPEPKSWAAQEQAVPAKKAGKSAAKRGD